MVSKSKTGIHLPSSPTPFIGRRNELASISARLAKPACRLLSLVGPGGNGKTRLSIEVARQNAPDFADGIYFVDLQPVSSADLLISTIAESIGFSFHGQEDPEAQLISFLSEKQSLLLLDNFEQMLEAADLLVRILTTAPGLKLLVTSREPLNLQEEWVWHVEGMDYPEDQQVAEINAFSALQLFAERAQRVRQDFSPDNELPCMIRICQLVRGMPLALELAAAWLKTLPCNKIVREIERNLDFLATKVRNIPERHRSLRAVFEQSWTLLNENERQVLKGLSVFRGGFRQAAAEAVIDASLSTLSSLVDKSLLNVDASGRFEIHDLLRQFAAERLELQAGEKEKIQAKHCAYYADFLFQRRDDSKNSKQVEFLLEIGDEIDNLRAAWNQAIADENLKAIDQSLESLYRFYGEKGWSLQGNRAFDNAVVMLRRGATIGDRGLILGRTLARQAYLCGLLSSYEKSRGLAQESLAIFETLGAHQETIISFMMLGVYHGHRGPVEKAQDFGQQMLAVATEFGDHWAMAMASLVLSGAVYLKGDYQKALRYLNDSLSLFRKIGDRWGVAWQLQSKSRVYNRLGQYQEALQQARESLAIARESNSQSVVIVSLLAFGDAAFSMGRSAEAEQHYQQGLTLAQETDARNLVEYLVSLADIAYLEEENKAAVTQYQRSLQVAHEVDDRLSIARSLQGLARIDYRNGDFHQAYPLLQESLSLSKAGGWQELTVSTLCSLGMTAHALGREDEAGRLLQEAVAAALAIDAPPVILESIAAAAWHLADSDSPEQMVAYLTFVHQHPATHATIRLQVERFPDELADKFPPPVLAAAQGVGVAEDPRVIAKTLLDKLASSDQEDRGRTQPQPLIEPLSDREIEVLRYMAAGMSNREIAEQLFITVGTAKVHASNIYGKLGVNNRTQAVARGRELNILDD